MGGRDPIFPNYSAPFSYAFLSFLMSFWSTCKQQWGITLLFSPEHLGPDHSSGCLCESSLDSRSHGDVCARVDCLLHHVHTLPEGGRKGTDLSNKAQRQLWGRNHGKKKKVTPCLFIEGDDSSAAAIKRSVVAFMGCGWVKIFPFAIWRRCLCGAAWSTLRADD